jgi:hypothetical protein
MNYFNTTEQSKYKVLSISTKDTLLDDYNEAHTNDRNDKNIPGNIIHTFVQLQPARNKKYAVLITELKSLSHK